MERRDFRSRRPLLAHQQKQPADDPIVRKQISSRYLIEVNTFCDSEATIRLCKARQDAETFRYDFSVAWFKDGRLMSRIAALNHERVKNALRKFFLAAHDAILRFAFVGLYVVRDIDAWVERIMLSVAKQELEENDAAEADECVSSASSFERDDDDDDDDDADAEKEETSRQTERDRRDARFYDVLASNLPFGVIPLGQSESEVYGHYELVEDRLALTRQLVFRPVDDRLGELYDFSVVDMGARFVSVRASPFDSCLFPTNTAELIPVSPFADLYMQYSLMREAETEVFDFNAMQTYRDEYAIAQPLEQQRVEFIPESTLYSENTMLGRRQKDAVDRQGWSMANAHSQLERVRMRQAFARPQPQYLDGGQLSVGMQRVAQFNRPSRSDFLVEIPKSVQMPNQSSGAPTFNLEQLQDRYDNEVCTVFSMPYIFFKPFGNRTGGGYNRSTASSGSTTGYTQQTSDGKIEFSQRLLNSEVRTQHALFDRLFREIYAKSFRKLDYDLLHDLPFYARLEAALDFEYAAVKSDAAITALLPFYEAGVIGASMIREFLYKSYGISEDPLPEPRDVKKEEARESRPREQQHGAKKEEEATQRATSQPESEEK